MRLKLSHVSKRFGETILFEDLSFELSEGEMVAVTGPSGSGKSTLLAIMSGLLSADTGSVELCESDQLLVPMHPQVTAWIPQGSNVLGARTVLDNAAIGALTRGVDRGRAERQATSALSLMGLGSRLTELGRVLSGGELQRLGVARALCSTRAFLFADEPTGSLDRSNTEAVVSSLRLAADHGTAVIIATHDRAVVPSCDREIALGGTAVV